MRVVLLLVTLFCQIGVAASAREIGGTDWQLEYRFALKQHDRQRISGWLYQQIEAIASLEVGFVPRRVVVELHRGKAGEPVSWAEIDRRDPVRVRFYIDPEASTASLVADWTASHEFAHLLIPFPGNDDIWFTEGLASYYQYVARAQAGLLTERQAWQGLLAGFARGRSDQRYAHLSLRALSPRMWATRSYYRVYWSGAVYFLLADVQLRQRSEGRWSLQQVLAHWHRCCRSQRGWNAARLAQSFDELTGLAVFEPLRRELMEERSLPPTAELFRHLGLRAGPPVQLLDQAPQASLRTTIMEGKPE